MAFFKLLSGENWEIYTIDGAVPCEDIQVVHIKHPKWKTISKLPPMGRKPVRLPLLVHPSTADATQRTSFLPPWKENDREFCLHCFLSLLYLSNPIGKKKANKKQQTGNIKKFEIQRYSISKQDLLLFFCSSNEPHTVTQPLNWVLILFSCHKTTSKMQREIGYLSHFLSYVALIKV